MHASNFKDLTGRRFGKVTVASYAGTDPHGNARWRCRCDCGKEFTTSGACLRSGRTASCGCSRKDTLRERLRRILRRKREEDSERNAALALLKDRMTHRNIFFLNPPLSVSEDFLGQGEPVLARYVAPFPGMSGDSLVFRLGKDSCGRTVTTEDITTVNILEILGRIPPRDSESKQL